MLQKLAATVQKDLLNSLCAMMQINGSGLLIELYQPGHRTPPFVRLGSLATDVSRPETRHCPLFPKSGQTPVRSDCPLCANSGLMNCNMIGAKRDRGEPRGSSPPTPPCVRVRTRRFDGLSRLSIHERS